MSDSTKTDARRSLNAHVSAADLKQIRGGVATTSKLGPDGPRVEKSDEDFPTIASAFKDRLRPGAPAPGGALPRPGGIAGGRLG